MRDWICERDGSDALHISTHLLFLLCHYIYMKLKIQFNFSSSLVFILQCLHTAFPAVFRDSGRYGENEMDGETLNEMKLKKIVWVPLVETEFDTPNRFHACLQMSALCVFAAVGA